MIHSRGRIPGFRDGSAWAYAGPVTETFTVRRATVDDVPARVDLYMDVAAEGRWIGGELPLDRDELIKRRTDTSETNPTWVAVADGHVIGELSLWLFKGGRADLGMEITKAWRARGVGSALLEAAIEWAREQNLDKIFLEVWPHNEAAIRLYEKVGFQREGYHPKHWRRASGEAWDTISMGLVLRE